MRVWALNLPQFYETVENNKWWGKGFTEWTTVKKAKPLYYGHEQPLVPLDNNYYDLSKEETIKWQADLAKRYGVECFVYYHYWYSGRHLLEKPCEVLLDSPEINMKYCFSWANHTWNRGWDGREKEVLIEQTYGNEKEWEEHLNYLLPFFKDPRYMRIDDKPVLFIYKPIGIDNVNARIDYWNRRLKEEGLSGIYVVEHLNSFTPHPCIDTSQAVFEDEPNFSCRYKISIFNKAKRFMCKKMKITDYQDYDKLWNLILKKHDTYDGRKIFLGGFPCWDNSPRKGKNSRIMKGASPEKFKDYLERLSKISRKDSLDIIVLNAWNEWGEGAILEPTEQYGYKYLDAVCDVVNKKGSS